ncbi:uncharacterized protein [Littorina saxatilis]|uniref:Ig-like domain-containing protein n=2 Tax=Littorina saxatilis TaxID=31220 RepID=A0AAN9B9R0_9CAEN
MTKLMCAVSLLVVACFFVKDVSAAALDLGTGSVRLQPYCSLARPDSRNSARVQCLVDSQEPSSSVTWSLVSQDGRVQELGTCTGLRASCTSTGGDPDISLSRWYSWNTATINNFDQKVGDTLVCSATHQGTERSERCVIGGQNQLAGYADCTVGESACLDKGWSISGIMNSIALCCPAGQGLIMDASNTQHPCRCNSGRR